MIWYFWMDVTSKLFLLAFHFLKIILQIFCFQSPNNFLFWNKTLPPHSVPSVSLHVKLVPGSFVGNMSSILVAFMISYLLFAYLHNVLLILYHNFPKSSLITIFIFLSIPYSLPVSFLCEIIARTMESIAGTVLI